MKQNNSLKAFTLFEILTVIAIVSILTLGVTRLNFNRLSNEQKASIELLQVRTIIEDMRNNALIGRAIDEFGNIPTYRELEINKTNNTLSGSTLGTIQITAPFTIENLGCKRIDGAITGTGSMVSLRFYSGSGITLSGCPANSKILDITLGRGDILKTLRINTVTQTIDEL